MSRRTTKILLISVILSLLQPSATAQNPTMWYVATTGSDAFGDGSIEHPFDTIQHAIGVAGNGDTVIVMEGKYAGPGNVNLNFLGKTILVRSRVPEDELCVRQTIIDGEGQGVIARFVSDEGPDSIFRGFSLIAGDASVPVRGVPGFFEFSTNAKPTTDRLRVVGGRSSHSESLPCSVVADSLYGNRIWDGTNPFHQPAATTDYYGSGDIDCDGALTLADVSLAQEMVGGSDPSPRADVDGNGTVNADDVSLINAGLTGSTLPGWWNGLSGRTERNAWVTKAIAIDQTNKHPYTSFFQCYSFAMQTFIHNAFYRGDLYYTDYNGGQTIFNLPMYHSIVAAPPYAHSIISILVGDDPLNFDDWRFIEPQTDYDVHPGMWDMPYGSTVRASVPTAIGSNGCHLSDKVTFHVDASGWSLQGYSSDLILSRPTPTTMQPDNRPDLWNPRIVPVVPGKVLFERMREDMSRVTDIHLATLPFKDPPTSVPLVGDSQYSRLLDIFPGPDGTIHVLWKGKPQYDPGLFYGQLNPADGTLTNVSRVSSGSVRVRMGRVIATPSGEMHVFWFQSKTGDDGIRWSRWTGTEWDTAQNLTPGIGSAWEWLSAGENRDLLRYFFDAVVLADGDIVLVWAEPIDHTSSSIVKQRRYDSQWSDPTVIETTNARGVRLVTDSAGTMHFVYWLGEMQLSTTEGRGNLLHRTYDGSSWSVPDTVDSSGGACCPHLTASAEGDVYAVWERRVGNQVIPVWAAYRDGECSPLHEKSVRLGADAWYPTLGLLPGGRLLIAWSSRSPDRATIEIATIDFYSVAAEPVIDHQPGVPGEIVAYTLHLTNTGTTTDTFTASVSGNTWSTIVSDTVGPLMAGANGSADVMVSIPVDAADNDTDTACIAITSQADVTQSATVTLTTTVEFNRLFLPLVRRSGRY